MKKIAIIISLLLISFKPPEKKYHLEFNEVQLNILWNAIDNSTAPHDQIKAVEALIQEQLKSQLDTSKVKK